MSQFFPVHYFEVLILLNRSAANFYSISKKNLDENFWKWEKLEKSSEKFLDFFENRDFSKFFEKIEIFRKHDFSKIIEIPLKIEKSWFRKISIFSKIFEISENFRKFFGTQLWRFFIFDIFYGSFWFFLWIVMNFRGGFG